MLIAKGKYLGNLRNEVEHLKSSNIIHTDAPLDNNGKGEQFSPTDLLSVALATCMVTIIGIWANNSDVELGKVSYSIEKHMGSAPRKVDRIKIEFILENRFDEKQRKKLENVAKGCPVALSLSNSLEQEIIFKYV